MGMQREMSVREEVVAHPVRKLEFKAALPAVTIALWALILGAAAYFLTGVGN